MSQGPEFLFKEARELADEAGFRQWLHDSRALSGRSLSDVVSRVRRVVNWLDILGPASDAEAEFRLVEDRRFRECTLSVQSQLRRATKLYREFKKQQRHV